MGLGTGCPYRIGYGIAGEKNTIADVPGVKVGQVTICENDIRTGVTAVLPHGGNLFREKVPAAAAVINGFGKTMGLVQIEEMGTIETPILLTNTLSIGTAATALIRYMLAQNPEIGRETGTVNPVVCECNDGFLSDIRSLYVRESHVWEAIETASDTVAEGCVGAGTGMSCLGFKGGIGSASRVLTLDGQRFTIGALTLCNFGQAGRLIVNGERLGETIAAAMTKEDKGSVIMLLATDLPLSSRQLKRLCRRAGAGLARTGSYYGNGSGDIAIAFSTVNRIPHVSEQAVLPFRVLHDDFMDPALDLAAETVEEAIISALWHAETTTGRDGHIRYSLQDALTSCRKDKGGTERP